MIINQNWPPQAQRHRGNEIKFKIILTILCACDLWSGNPI